MIKSKLIEKLLKDNPQFVREDIELALNCFLDEITDVLARGDRVELRGFGSFSVKIKGAHESRNPATGTVIHVKERPWPKFRPSANLRAKVNSLSN